MLLAVLLTAHSFSQRGIGTNAPNAASILELKSTNKGFLMPRMNQVQMKAIVPHNSNENVAGLLVYCTDCQPRGVCVFNGNNGWETLKRTEVNPYTIDCSFSYINRPNNPHRTLFNVHFTKKYDHGPDEIFFFSAADVSVSGHIVEEPYILSHTFTPTRRTIMISYPIIGFASEGSTGTIDMQPFGSCSSVNEAN